jgi:hypothetical protein
MTRSDEFPEVNLAELLAELPPAPEAWVQAASELPRLSRDLDRIMALIETDRAFRSAVLVDIEHALRKAGVEPTRTLVEAVRVRLER